ncbi:hypothetical protein NQ318_011949 [Aromia moschata]|uniref:Uncharacterized protein n=1 Tax=Aromia moschata TaxID=1265417 RepID=A0AAV8XGI9_9CUCU|nr:hypothetical protein NQ318_011949 [Aromia moschata]
MTDYKFDLALQHNFRTLIITKRIHGTSYTQNAKYFKVPTQHEIIMRTGLNSRLGIRICNSYLFDECLVGLGFLSLEYIHIVEWNITRIKARLKVLIHIGI